MSATTEYGIFTDEGCVEREFYSFEKATEVAQRDYDAADDVTVSALCPLHDEQAAIDCEACNAEPCDECGENLDECGCERCGTCGETMEGACEC